MRFVGIDPSTKTGFVALDEKGNVLVAKEIQGKGEEDPRRMSTMNDEIIEHLKWGDLSCIEGFGFNSQRAHHLGGIGWLLRCTMYKQGLKYLNVAPPAVKKFAGGKGNSRKDELAVHIFKQWGFEHESDNVRDAFILAQIARAIHLGNAKTVYQHEVIKKILNPPPPKKKCK